LCLKQKKNLKEMEQFQAFQGKKIDVIKMKHYDTSSGTASFLSNLNFPPFEHGNLTS